MIYGVDHRNVTNSPGGSGLTTTSRQKEIADRLRYAVDFVRVSDLAAQFGVTIRTVLRDVDALRLQGHVITGMRGRGGGLRLEQDSIRGRIEVTSDFPGMSVKGDFRDPKRTRVAV